jgi:cell division protein FtsB
MVSDNVLISFIATLGGVVGTYITVRYRNQRPKAKSRVDEALDVYERTIKQLDAENHRLRNENALLRGQKE